MGEFAGDIESLLRFTSAVRELDIQLPTQCLHVLLLIAAKPGTTLLEIQNRTGLSTSSVSRNVGKLSTVNRQGEAGYGLIASVPSADHAQRVDLYLTAKGLTFMRRLLRASTGKAAEAFNPRVVK